MQKPPTPFLAAALDTIRELDCIARNLNCATPAAGSPAGNENIVANRSGIDPQTDFVSIPGVCLLLRLKLYAAREHLLACIWLLRSNAERTMVNPIQALTRSAVEASATSIWVCSNKITWEERLRRFSQLHLRSTYNCLKDEGFNATNRPDPATVHPDIVLTWDECQTLINEVKARGWTCRKGKHKGKTPTISRWVAELPKFSDIVQDAATIVSLPADGMRAIYSMSSRSVHTDPVMVAGGSTEEEEMARLYMALDATTTALMIYGLTWKLVASWCSVPYPEEAMQNHFARMRQYE